jgi:hypothetical protein
MSDETSLKLLRQSYNLAKEAKGEDRLTARDVAEAKKVVKARKVYETAKKNKGEDRITQADINAAEKSIPKFSKGSKKPIKAVAGVLAGLAAGIAPGVIGLGMLAKKKSKTTAVAEPNNEQYAMNNQSKIVDLYQKATGTAKMKTGGDVVVGKGGDYIKDLID